MLSVLTRKEKSTPKGEEELGKGVHFNGGETMGADGHNLTSEGAGKGGTTLQSPCRGLKRRGALTWGVFS